MLTLAPNHKPRRAFEFTLEKSNDGNGAKLIYSHAGKFRLSTKCISVQRGSVNFEEPPEERETDFTLTIKNWQDKACGPCAGGSKNKKYKTLHFRAGTVEDKKLWIDHFKRISSLRRLKDKARLVPDDSSDTSSSTCVSSIDEKPSIDHNLSKDRPTNLNKFTDV